MDDSNEHWRALYRVMIQDRRYFDLITPRDKKAREKFLKDPFKAFWEKPQEMSTAYIWNVFEPYVTRKKVVDKSVERVTIEKFFIDNPIAGTLRVGNPRVYNPAFSAPNPAAFDILIHRKGLTLVENSHDRDRELLFYHYDLKRVVIFDQDSLFERG